MVHWDHDRLGRKAEAERFIAYVRDRALSRMKAGNPEAFVVAVEGNWGTGKTFFLQGVERDLQEHHPVAYLNAWENDTLAQPFLALLDALDRALQGYIDQPDMREKTGRLLRSAGKVAGAAIIGGGKKLATRWFGDELSSAVAGAVSEPGNDERKHVTDEAADAAAEAGVKDALEQAKGLTRRLQALSTREALNQLAAYRTARAGKAELRSALNDIVGVVPHTNDTRLPVFIIVDELDRCQPDYAVALLEELKHLFNVPGLVFILGMERTQLAATITGRYGGMFNGEGFLDKLVHLRYELSQQSTEDLVKYAFDIDPPNVSAFMGDPFHRELWQEVADIALIRGLSPRGIDRMMERFRAASHAAQGRMLSATVLASFCALGLNQQKARPPKFLVNVQRNRPFEMNGRRFELNISFEAAQLGNVLGNQILRSVSPATAIGALDDRDGHHIFGAIHFNKGWVDQDALGAQYEMLIKEIAPFVPAPVPEEGQQA